MRRLSVATLDAFIRTLVCLGLVVSSIGISAPVSVAQARPVADPPISPTITITPPPVTATAIPFASPLSTPQPPLTPTAMPSTSPTPIAPPPVTETAPLTASVSLTPTLGLTPTQAMIGAAGGRLHSADRRIQLDVPPGLFKKSTRLSITPRLINSNTEVAGPRLRFDLEAVDPLSSAGISQFEQPLTLTVNISGVIDLAQIPANQHVYLGYRTPEGQRVEITPLHFNADTGSLSVAIDHFSPWEAGVAPGTPGVWSLVYTPPQAALYSGAVAYQIPIQVPEGRNGLQPDLSIGYSSASLNGRTGADAVERGPFGDSWTLSTMTLSRDRWLACEWNPDGQTGHLTEGTCFQDIFTLIVNGSGHELNPAPGPVLGRYYVKDGPGIFVERHSGCSSYNTTTGLCNPGYLLSDYSPENTTGEYWIVRLADGTTARLGYTADAEQVNSGLCTPLYTRYCHTPGQSNQLQLGYKGRVTDRAARSWRVDTMTDTLGNTMVFNYSNHLGWGGTTEDRVTLRNIYYNYNPGTGTWLSRVEFAGNDTPADGEPTIDEIRVYNASSTQPQQPVLQRKYVITRATDTKHYNDCWGRGPEDTSYTAMTAVQEYDGTGATALPATTFTYVWQPKTQDCKSLKQLSTVTNGYGAVTTLTYENAGGWNNYRLSSLTTTGGLSGSAPHYSTYTYGNACYDSYGSACASRSVTLCGSACDTPSLAGFSVVTATQRGVSNEALAMSVHYFFNANPAWQIGHEYRTQQYDPNNLMTQVDSTYDKLDLNGTTFTFVQRADETTYANGAWVTKRTEYVYDNYGNQTAEYDYGNLNLSDDNRSIHRFYHNLTNNGRWFIGLKYNENIFSTITPYVANSTLLKTQTFWYYDDYTYNVDNWSVTDQINKGLVTMEGHGLYNHAPDPYVTTKTAYDSQWGVPTTITDPRGNQTSVVYDSLYHLYPVQITGPRPSVPPTTYQFYGINGVPADNYTPIGLLKKTIDPNSAETTYAYDTFGRLLTVARPYDTSSIPTTQYQYAVYNANGLSGLRVIEAQREITNNSSANHPVVNFYDGTGQLVQTRSETVDGTQQAVTNIVYDARGQAQYQYAPALETFTWDFSRPTGWDSRPRTQTVYDALGRTTQVINPDGTATTNTYYIAVNPNDGDFNNGGRITTNVTDANNHVKRYSYDADGHILTVSEDLTGSESRTHYTYDVLGNLKTVRDAANNVTQLNYDVLGRKTNMTDPDMGYWTYTYDNAGNLTTQDDANRQRTCFYYDELNRLTGKLYRYIDDNCPTGNPVGDVIYTYDQGTNGKGRRTAMTDPSGSTSWTYDQRGRVTSEAKTIDGVAYNTGYTYDAMDRVTSTAYPSNETVYQTYNAATQLSSVYGASTYASGLTYNALGQLTQMTYGNGTSIKQGYWGTGGNWDTRLGSGLQSFGRLWRTRAQSSTGLPLYDVRYSYDNVGNVTRMQEAPRAATNWPTAYTFQDAFTTKDTTNWAWSAYQTVPFNDGGNSVVKSTGTGANWNATFYRNAYSLASGQGLQIRIKVDNANSNSVYGIEANDATYRRFGIVVNNGKIVAQYNDGSGYVSAADLLTTLQLNTWYVLRISVDDSGGFYEEVYQESNPAVRGSYARVMTAGRTWRFHQWIYSASNAYLDDYSESLVSTFDTSNTVSWAWSAYQTVPFNDGGNNVVKSAGTNADWNANFYRTVYAITSTRGLQLRFKVDVTNTASIYAIEANDATYRRFSVVADGGRLYVQYNDGSGYRAPADLLPNLQINTWYVLRIVADDARGFYVEAYQESNPAIRGSYNQWMPTGLAWRFHHWIYRGTAYLDDYFEFNATGLAWNTDERMTFTYDALDRLYSAAPESGGQGYAGSYRYTSIGNITRKGNGGPDNGYDYAASASNCTVGTPGIKPHAASRTWDWTSYATMGSYSYDCNGNMTQRIEGGVTYSQQWTEENRLKRVIGNGQDAQYFYDGDGNRVKKVQNGVTTVYIGAIYEKNLNTSEVTTYYFAGSQRVAMRKNGVPTWFMADHLGSTSLALDAGGYEVANSRQKYYPFGETRSGSSPTDRQFTGQRAESGLGSLYDFNARMYSPSLGRFLSADTVVPDAKNPQAWNRYSYGFNSPLIYKDPSGHCPVCIAAIIAAAILSGCSSQPAVNDAYKSSGFLLEGFDAHETQVVGETISAYSNAVGGADQLQKLMLASNNGAPVTIKNDTSQVGSNAGINLGTGAFDMKAAAAANFSDWGAADNDTKAKYTLGHEIGHRLISAMRPTTDWAEKYKNSVSPDGIPAWTGSVADGGNSDYEQEAVTNLALRILGAGYYWSTFTNGKDATRKNVLDNWTTDFVDDLTNFK